VESNPTQPLHPSGSGQYWLPQTLGAALELLGVAPYPTVLAGGTDFYPGRVGRAIAEPVLDVSALDELRGIREHPGRFDLGARTTWSDLLRAPLPALFDGLKLAAREVGGVQIQNAGTIAGNLCNASPAADGVPPLLAMDAEVELKSLRGSRVLSLDRFLLGNRKTAIAPDELLTAVRIPKPAGAARSGFLKLGSRRYLVISIAMVAAVLEADGAGRVARARVALGACSPVAQRLPDLEAALAGQTLDRALGEAVRPEHLKPLSPIDDVRGSAGYRMDAALTLVRRLLGELGGRP